MWEGLLKREVLVDFMGFESVFGFVEATEWFAVEGVFMGGVLLGCGWMLPVGWDGNFSSAGPVRDAAHERNVEGGSFPGGWRGSGFTAANLPYFYLAASNGLLFSSSQVFRGLKRQSNLPFPLRLGH